MNKNKERKFLLGSLGPAKCVSWPVAFKDFAWVKLCKGSWSREKWWASVKFPWPTPLCYLTLACSFPLLPRTPGELLLGSGKEEDQQT